MHSLTVFTQCYSNLRDSRNPSCPVCQDSFNELAQPLPFAHCSQSRLVCAISGRPLNEHNLPMMLPNGYVYGERVSFIFQNTVHSKCMSPAWYLLTSQSASEFLNCISGQANTWYVHVLIISYYCFRPWSRWLLKTMVRSFAPKQKRFIHSKSSKRCLWCKYCTLLLLIQSCRSMVFILPYCHHHLRITYILKYCEYIFDNFMYVLLFNLFCNWTEYN